MGCLPIAGQCSGHLCIVSEVWIWTKTKSIYAGGKVTASASNNALEGLNGVEHE